MAIPDNNYLYGEWRQAVKDQMLATGFRKIHTFLDHHFQLIVVGMRTLRPAWNTIVTAAAANNRAVMHQIDEAVVQLVKDCGVRLRTTVKNHSTGLAPLGQNGVFYDQLMLSDRLLPANAPDQWGPPTTVPNPGPVSQNVPPAYPPQEQNVPAYHGKYLPPAHGVVVQNVPAHHRNYLPPAQGVAVQNVPNHPGNYLPAAQGVALQGLAAQGLAAQGLAAQGLAVQGLAAQGLAAQGLAAQGVLAQNVPDYHGNYPPQAQNLPSHHGNYLPPDQGVPAQNVPDHHRNYPPPGKNVPSHPAIYPPAGQNIPGLPSNYTLRVKTQLPFPPITLFLIH